MDADRREQIELQEFMEAITFCSYLNVERVLSSAVQCQPAADVRLSVHQSIQVPLSTVLSSGLTITKPRSSHTWTDCDCTGLRIYYTRIRLEKKDKQLIACTVNMTGDHFWCSFFFSVELSYRNRDQLRKEPRRWLPLNTKFCFSFWCQEQIIWLFVAAALLNLLFHLQPSGLCSCYGIDCLLLHVQELCMYINVHTINLQFAFLDRSELIFLQPPSV